MLNSRAPFWLFMILVTFMVSCTDDDPEIEVKENVPVTLTGSTFAFSRRTQEIKAFVDAASLDIPSEKLKYNVDLYKVEYTTGYKGNEITASGVVMIPDTKEPVSMLSFQHGTIAANREAPSQLPSSDLQLILYQGIAAAGFVVVVPDYIGFGASVDIMHPYYVEDLTASAVIDQIYGAKNLADELEVNLTRNLYLAGYSQGGYATMAAHKSIEENELKGFDLQASFASSGGYDIDGVRDFFFDQQVYHQPFFLAYVAQAYEETLDLEGALTDYFNEPYASAIPAYFDGSYTGSQINSMLNDTLSVLVHPDFLANEENDTRFEPINSAFTENSLLDWTPATRLFLYHGDADITVPYQNSVDSYNQLLANGASESTVSFTTLSGATHGTGFLPYLEEFINDLIELENL